MRNKFSLEEIEEVLHQFKKEGKEDFINVEIDEHRLYLKCVDKDDNLMEAILYSDRTIGAEFRKTERLMYMRSKAERELKRS